MTEALPEAQMDEAKRPARVETAPEYLVYLTRPTQNPEDSTYAKYLTKDDVVSYLREGNDLKIAMLYSELVEALAFCGLTDMANAYHYDLQKFLSLRRSIGGFERKAQTESTQVIEKRLTQGSPSGGGFPFGGK